MPNEKEKLPELKEVTSLKDLMFEGEAVQLDLTEDAWEFAAPPPQGVYDLKLFFAKEAWKMGQLSKNESDIYLQANLECRIVSDNEEFNNVPVFTRVDTRCFRGKQISTIAGLMVKLGYAKTLEKEGGKLSPKKLASYLELALKKEPIIKAELDWKGSYKYSTPKGEDKWENHFTTYKSFPDTKDKTGKQHISMVSNKAGGMIEVRAQLQVVKFFGKGDELPKFGVNGAAPLVSQPRLVPKSQIAEEKVELEHSKVNTPAPVASEESDLELMLAE